MRFLSKLMVFASVSMATFANAGHFTVVSTTTHSNPVVSSISGHTFLQTPTLGTGSFGLNTKLYPSPPSPGFKNGSALVYHLATVVVQWHPDPGDPANPQDWPAIWTLHQEGEAGGTANWLLPFTTSYMDLLVTLMPDPANLSFSDTFDKNHSAISPFDTDTDDYSYGSFTFYTSGGNTYATGTFSLGFEMEYNNYLSAMEAGGVGFDIKQSLTLTAVGSYPVW